MDATDLMKGLTRLRNARLHLGVAGSVACYKSCDLLRHLLAIGIHVSATLTPGARQFVSPLLFSALGAMPVYTELFADAEPFAHLEPGQNCQAMLVCPASASIMARMAQGQASDIEIEAREIMKFKKELYTIIADHSHTPFEKVWNDSDRNYWMTAEEAKEYGMIDQVMVRKTAPADDNDTAVGATNDKKDK